MQLQSKKGFVGVSYRFPSESKSDFNYFISSFDNFLHYLNILII